MTSGISGRCRTAGRCVWQANGFENADGVPQAEPAILARFGGIRFVQPVAPALAAAVPGHDDGAPVDRPQFAGGCPHVRAHCALRRYLA
jgi:hypothetical protein